ncbi:MAG: glycosyltransferase [Candidatus Nanopelagicales bacterium]
MQEVRLPARSPMELAGIVPPERLSHLVDDVAPRMREALQGRSVVNVNSTAVGGGVAEMLQVLLPLSRGADVDARWLVLDGEPDFYAITKRLHHRLHGSEGDGGPLGQAEHEVFDRVSRANSDELAATVVAGDVVILHDPQPAGLAAAVRSWGVPVVWRCHVGVDFRNEYTDEAWDFLRPYLEPSVDAYVFTREAYAPDWVPRDRLAVIKPSIDPLAAKNRALDPDVVVGALQHVGIIDGGLPDVVPFTRSDGSPGRVLHHADIIRTGPPPQPDVPLVVQVSRWDPLKDMAGVMHAFAEHIIDGNDAHLVLAGPVVTAVSDDPEGAVVLHQVWEQWRDLPHAARTRIQLACLPMADVEENAVIVNALQRHAAVVVQKSYAEGFGLTVTEALYKGRPVVASAVGGIVDQITDGQDGLLLPDPADLVGFGERVRRLLDDPPLAARLGEAAHRRAVDEFLPDTSLVRWENVLAAAMTGRAVPPEDREE